MTVHNQSKMPAKAISICSLWIKPQKEVQVDQWVLAGSSVQIWEWGPTGQREAREAWVLRTTEGLLQLPIPLISPGKFNPHEGLHNISWRIRLLLTMLMHNRPDMESRTSKAERADKVSQHGLDQAYTIKAIWPLTQECPIAILTSKTWWVKHTLKIFTIQTWTFTIILISKAVRELARATKSWLIRLLLQSIFKSTLPPVN